MKISVRSLVEFILRSGDIDNRTDTGTDPDAMKEGTRIHKKLQKSMGPNYRAEVPLKRRFEDSGLVLILEGRADGILTEEDGSVLIDEIKGIYEDPGRLAEPYPLHLAQAKCYAGIYAAEKKLSSVQVQLRYCGLSPAEDPEESSENTGFSETDTYQQSLFDAVPDAPDGEKVWSRKKERIRRFSFVYSAKELEEWLQKLVSAYFVWAHFLADHTEKRNASALALDFPFAYRPGQKETARDVYRAIVRSRNLFIQAPTGTGKTLSVVFPSVKAIGEGLADKIFYLTAKTVTRAVAQDAFRLLSGHGLVFKTVTLTAKEKACANGEFLCNPDDCPYAKGHFDRVNDAVLDILTNENLITRQNISVYAEKHRVCPYEFSLDISSWCDAVIGDYNYAFDPRVRLRRFFSDGAGGDYLFLIDEAHNLVSRASEMFSATLRKEDILACKRITRGMSAGLTRALDRCNREMLAIRHAGEYGGEKAGGISGETERMQAAAEKAAEISGETERMQAAGEKAAEISGKTEQMQAAAEKEGEISCKTEQIQVAGETITVLPNVNSLDLSLMKLYPLLHRLIDRRKHFPERELVMNFFFAVKTFLDTGERTGEGYRIYARSGEDHSFFVKLLCIDPSRELEEGLSMGRTAVFFSATLLPVNFYKELLTGNPDDYAIYVPGSFRERMRFLAVGRDVSSRYGRRNHFEYAKIANYILKTVRQRAGNYLCFFPSYEYLGKVAELLSEEIQALAGTVSTEAQTAAEGPYPASGRNGTSFRLLYQKRAMSEAEREGFLSEFNETGTGTRIGLCVMGGIFSEGIDLAEEKLIGAIIVGTGLPMINAESELAREYFDAHGKPGFDYAYRFPGMNKVMQAAGRVIRTDKDTGVILLLDDRFLRREYRVLFPREWANHSVTTLDTVEKQVREFWNEI